MKQKTFKIKQKVNKIEITTDKLTGRGGILLFSRYLHNTGIFQILDKSFGNLRKSRKGIAIWQVFKQVFLFLYDGTSRHINYFDMLKRDDGYAGAIEEPKDDLLSSHQVKRFFKLFHWLLSNKFRIILRHLFVCRLLINRPKTIYLTLDTMVMDNDEALKRHGVQPTYKKKKGFQPLQLIWNRRLVDAIFRGGKKHSNYSDHVVKVIKENVNLIRQKYDPKATIILCLDSGFFDEVNIEACNNLNIGFIISGKMYKNIKEFVSGKVEKKCKNKYYDVMDNKKVGHDWEIYKNGKGDGWEYMEFGYKCDSWKTNLYRTFYTRPHSEDGQRIFEFARPDNVILTNIGINDKVLENLSETDQKELLTGNFVISTHHKRGADELPHRGLKDFGFEQLPFKRFSPNTVFYYCMVISFFLFENYKEDVLDGVVSVVSYATTVRRKVLDFAAKIVKTGHRIIFKITERIMEELDFRTLWQRCQSPPVL